MRNNDTFFIILSTLILSSLILFFNIQSGEVQPWDEGLYAYRAREILNTNQWWDQTSISLGGLYSSTYPPLVPWAIAINMKIFGENLFAIRLFSIICSVVTIFLFISFFSKQFDYILTFLVGFNLLLSSHWLFYSRQGMTDIPLLFFVLANILVSIKFLEEQKKNNQLVFGILVSLTFFLALMTKIVVSLIPLLTLLFTYYYFGKKTTKNLLLFYFFGFVLALPWYFYMGIKYGSAFLSALFPPHLFSVVEENQKPLGILFYINQLLISNPFAIFSFASIFIRLKSKKLSNFFFSGNFISDVFFFWYIAGLFVFSLAPTKLPHYTLYLLPPALYIILELISFHFVFLNKKMQLVLIVLTLANTFWYFTPSFRESIKAFEMKTSFLAILLFLLSVFIILFTYFYERKRRIDTIFSTKFATTFFYIISITILVVSIFYLAKNPTGKIFGGKETANFLQRNKLNSFVYLFHKVNDSDTLNPQLAWYTKGDFFGKNPKKSIIFLSLPIDRIGLTELKQLEFYPNEYVVYYTFSKNLPRRIIVEQIIKERKILIVTPNYIIFGKKVKNNNEDKVII
ncbi:MAG: ArnT family glycosyltransferase [Candidatus Kapaibacteriota bacterium]